MCIFWRRNCTGLGQHHGIKNPNRRGGALGQIPGAGGVRKKRTFFSHAGGRSSISILRSNSPRPNSPGLWITPLPSPLPRYQIPPNWGRLCAGRQIGQGGAVASPVFWQKLGRFRSSIGQHRPKKASSGATASAKAGARCQHHPKPNSNTGRAPARHSLARCAGWAVHPLRA